MGRVWSIVVVIALAAVPSIRSVGAEPDKYQRNASSEVVALKNEARVLLKTDQPAKAVQKLEKAVEKMPDYYLGHFNLGLAHLVAGQKAKAIESFERARQIADQEKLRDPSIFNTLGWVYLQQGEPAKAVPLFERALEVEPSYAKSLNNLGVALEALGRFDEARAAYEKAKATGTGRTRKNAEKHLERLQKWTAASAE
jgi:Flp pilus assembly protein TadD